MSSQAPPPPSIPLAHAPDGLGYKLVELPPELVSLLESDNPPVLSLHASPTAALLRAGPATTYALRQKNTSNALVVLAPAPATPGLHAVATVHETIELVAETAGSAAPARGRWHERFARGR
ncbi:hypothetical protein P8C59_003003 [Phyllachora maydis]|uniref:Sister chromatid cohesion protein DCC1 n=1 Tax=Phyllachora maydis TaxID=1825666 RepID=A0AAD9I0Y9_9PEZI|nr:hypothetical protein P8C59_003003 [Phyllachora maydis]